jgi:hypothetical protein
MGAPLLPALPPSEKCKKKIITKFFHQLQKIEKKNENKYKGNLALATMAKYVRTQFQSLRARHQRVLLF